MKHSGWKKLASIIFSTIFGRYSLFYSHRHWATVVPCVMTAVTIGPRIVQTFFDWSIFQQKETGTHWSWNNFWSVSNILSDTSGSMPPWTIYWFKSVQRNKLAYIPFLDHFCCLTFFRAGNVGRHTALVWCCAIRLVQWHHEINLYFNFLNHWVSIGWHASFYSTKQTCFVWLWHSFCSSSCILFSVLALIKTNLHRLFITLFLLYIVYVVFCIGIWSLELWRLWKMGLLRSYF